MKFVDDDDDDDDDEEAHVVRLFSEWKVVVIRKQWEGLVEYLLVRMV